MRKLLRQGKLVRQGEKEISQWPQEPPMVGSNLGPQLEAGGAAIRQGAALQGNQRKAMLLRLSGMKILGSG
jgi:hypothetical protein